jgi:plastocyanin
MQRVPCWYAVFLFLAGSTSLSAQAFLNRTPNFDGVWLPDRLAMQFNFIHRFYVTPGPTNAVINSPTFTWAFRLPGPIAIGTRYSTRSAISGRTNEFELFGRWRLSESGPNRVGAAITPAWNNESKSLDGELAANWSPSRFTVLAAVRGMSHAFDSSRARAALGTGLVVRLNSYVAVGGDVATLLARAPSEKAAWSAGLLFQIPNSPHFFALQVSNVDVNTIEGSSRRGLLSGSVGKPLYGFEFTIPLHYRRFTPWLRPGTGVPPRRMAQTPATSVRMVQFEFRSDTVVVGVGQAVEFRNDDPVEHTVTFDAIATSSGLIPPGGTFVLRFDRPGMWVYHCTPHPFMQGVIIVR